MVPVTRHLLGLVQWAPPEYFFITEPIIEIIIIGNNVFVNIPNNTVNSAEKNICTTTKTPYYKTANSSLVSSFDLDKFKAILAETSSINLFIIFYILPLLIFCITNSIVKANNINMIKDGNV